MAADDSFNVDALLNDLDEAMGSSNSNSGRGDGPATIKFTPHPPRTDRSPSKNNNPKTKFTVSARSGDGSNNDKDDLKKHDTIVYNNTDDELNTIGNNFDSDDDVDHDNDNVFSSSFGSTGMSEKRKENSSNYCNNNNNNNTNTTNDENSLDNLIEMLKNTTPQQSPVSKPTFNVPITNSPILNTNATNTFGGVFSPDLAKAAIQKGAEVGLASQMNTSYDIFDEDFDDLAADSTIIRTNSNTESNENSNKSNITGSSSASTSGTKSRCSRVHVGGPSVPRGLKASAFSKCVCSNLMCINCNFKVIFFNHKQWSESVDYMFFRNNFPNESKLSTMTSANDENTAYCCQCSWIQVKDEKEIHQNSNPKWICAGHYDK